MQYNLVDVYRHLGGASSDHRQGRERRLLGSIATDLPDYTSSRSRRRLSS